MSFIKYKTLINPLGRSFYSDDTVSLTPTPDSEFMLTEAGDDFMTEDGSNLFTEGN